MHPLSRAHDVKFILYQDVTTAGHKGHGGQAKEGKAYNFSFS